MRSILKAVLSDAASSALIEHRKALKAPLTARAAELLVVHLNAAPAGCDLTPDQAVDVMIERGWQGFKSDWVLKARQQRAPPGRPTSGPRERPPPRNIGEALFQNDEGNDDDDGTFNFGLARH